VQVARVHVELRGLLGNGPHDHRVAVAHMRHVVVRVQVVDPVGAAQPYPLPDTTWSGSS